MNPSTKLSKETQPAKVPWDKFPAYLIEKHEGDEISEELLQQALAAMLLDPDYYSHPTRRRAKQRRGT